MTQRIVVTLAILAGVFVSTYVSAPGINPQAFDSPASNAALRAMAASHVSIIALQFSPVYSALVLFEMLKLALPGMTNWRSNSPAITRAMLIVALVLAYFQGWGVASALEGAGASTAAVTEPGTPFRFAFTLTQLAGVCLLVVCAGIITRYGIGSGYWVMLAAFPLAASPMALGTLSESYAEGMIDPVYLVALAAAISGGAAAVAALYRRGVAAGNAPQEAAADLILPPFLGLALGSVLYGLSFVPGLFFGGQPPETSAMTGDNPLRLAMIVGSIVTIALLRVGKDRRHGLQIAAVTSAIAVVLEIADAHLGVALIRGDILVITVIVCALAWDHAHTYSENSPL